MDWGVPLLLFAQLLVAIVMGAVATYLSILLFDRATRELDEWKELRNGNVAVGIVLGAIVVAVVSVIRPALRVPFGGWDVGNMRMLFALGVEAVQLLVGLALAMVSILFAVWIFDRLTTQLDEWAEIKKGNVAVAALLAGVILAISMLVGIALEGILQAITPFLF